MIVSWKMRMNSNESSQWTFMGKTNENHDSAFYKKTWLIMVDESLE
jgi:hypothetical protein